MITRLESSVVKAIMKAINATPGAKCRKLWGSSLSVSGDPDIYGAWPYRLPDGQVIARMFHLEVKAPGKAGPTKLQVHRLAEWQSVGCIVGVPRSVEEALDYLTGAVVWKAPERENEGEWEDE